MTLNMQETHNNSKLSRSAKNLCLFVLALFYAGEGYAALSLEEMVDEISDRGWVVDNVISGHYQKYTIFQLKKGGPKKIIKIDHEVISLSSKKRKGRGFFGVPANSFTVSEFLKNGTKVANAIQVCFKFDENDGSGDPDLHSALFTFTILGGDGTNNNTPKLDYWIMDGDKQIDCTLHPDEQVDVDKDGNSSGPIRILSAHGRGTGT